MVSKCIEVHNVWEWYFLDNLENLNTVQPNLPDESLVPALDDLARPQREGEGTAAGNAGVKLAPIFFQCPLQEIHVNVSCFKGKKSAHKIVQSLQWQCRKDKKVSL